MPMRSKAQNRFFHWAAEHPQESDVKPSVSKDFIDAQHGHPVKSLPERVAHKAHGGRATVMKPRPTGH